MKSFAIVSLAWVLGASPLLAQETRPAEAARPATTKEQAVTTLNDAGAGQLPPVSPKADGGAGTRETG